MGFKVIRVKSTTRPHMSGRRLRLLQLPDSIRSRATISSTTSSPARPQAGSGVDGSGADQGSSTQSASQSVKLTSPGEDRIGIYRPEAHRTRSPTNVRSTTCSRGQDDAFGVSSRAAWRRFTAQRGPRQAQSMGATRGSEGRSFSRNSCTGRHTRAEQEEAVVGKLQESGSRFHFRSQKGNDNAETMA